MTNTYMTSAFVAVCALLVGCSSTPKRIDELEAARTAVLQVEASPRVGVAAEQISEARNALDRADRMASAGKLDDVRFYAEIAQTNAQIAYEKIATAEARDSIDNGTAERQAVLAEARERDAQRWAQRATQQQERATEQQQRAAELQQELSELRAKQTDRGIVVTLGDVLFDTDKARLKPAAYGTMDRVAQVLKGSAERRVLIEGHTDSTGSAEYNTALSERRADAVRTALLERGIPSEQVHAIGRGESMPVASNDNAGGRQANRRVELVFPRQPQTATDTQ
jgi:outer membrane protein OmpA-like peptidoglycan-associated protein